MSTATRTLHPLHFEDLEPHRFEDLVRQLLYDFRPCRSIEAVGRLGADEGIDIRAVEGIRPEAEGGNPEFSEEDEPGGLAAAEGRVWNMQCKRERSITPAKVRTIVTADLSRQDKLPYAYILVAACDFSKRSRDAFRQTIVPYGVQEFHLWGKAELEDMLFQPKNDHLLFAYFGISLQVRRRSLRTDIRAKLALKRKLVAVLGGVRESAYATVLIRDPRDETYPRIVAGQAEAFLRDPKWRYWEFAYHRPPFGLAFVTQKYLAYIDWETGSWDALFQCYEGLPGYPELYGIPSEISSQWPVANKGSYWTYWNTTVARAENQAYLKRIGTIPYERIIALEVRPKSEL